MLLVKRGLITDEQLAIALEDQRTSGEHLGTILLARGFATPASVAQALATQHGGLLKTEYGFATGFGTGVSQSGTVAEPPVSSATIGKPETEVAASTRRRSEAGLRVASCLRRPQTDGFPHCSSTVRANLPVIESKTRRLIA